jgi:Right handed beta helix region
MSQARFVFVLFFIVASSVCDICSAVTTYYVRANGKDTNTGRSRNRAWKTLEKAASMAGPDVTIYVGAGTYSSITTVNFNKTANSARPCRIIADTTGARTGDSGDVIIQAPNSTVTVFALSLSNVSDYYFTGFTFKEDPTVSVPVYSANNATEYNAYYTNWGQGKNIPAGIHVSGGSRITVDNCKFEGLYYGAQFNSTNNCTISNTTFNNSRFMALYSWCNRGFTVSNSSFNANSTATSHNYSYQVYSSQSDTNISGCSFASPQLYEYVKTLNRADGSYGYKYRNANMIYSHGFCYSNDLYNTYATNYNATKGNLTVNNCSFNACTYLAVNSVWDASATITNSTMTNCKYGVYCYDNTFNVANNTIANDTDAEWSKDWSYGVYANVFNSPNNRDNSKNPYRNTWITTGTPGGTISNTTINNYRYGLLIASADVSPSNLTIGGNTDYAYTNSGWTGTKYTYGIYCYDNANKNEFRGDQNLNLTNHWHTFYSDGGEVTYKNMNISGVYAGIVGYRSKVNITGTTVSNCKYYGAYFGDCPSLTATNSSFSDNCKAGYWGWGLYYQGAKAYRTPQSSGGPDWNAHQEYWVYGTPLGDVNIQNCSFHRNGTVGVNGSGGLGIASCDKNKVVLANNQATYNHSYGVYILDTEVTLANNQEFTTLAENWAGLAFQGYRDIINQTLPHRTGKATITNYNISDCAYGLIGAEATLSLTNVNCTNNDQYGLYVYNGHLTMRNSSMNLNRDGAILYYNLTNDIKDCTFSNNTQYGAIHYLFNSWYGENRAYTCRYDGVTANDNGYSGLYTSIYRHQANGAWDMGDPTLFNFKNVTCNNNKSHGFIMRGGWLNTSTPCNITCNGNGSYDANGNGQWGIGLYVESPQTDISLNNSQNIVATNNSWGGIYINDTHWQANPTTGKSDFFAGEHNLSLTGFTQGANKYYGVYANVMNHITVANSNVAGLYLAEPQGNVSFTDSQFQNGWQGAVISWGSFEYWNDLASGVIVNTWWNTTANIVNPLHKPTSITINNCQFLNNVYYGLQASWWNKWDVVATDSNKRMNVSVENSSFTRNGYSGFVTYNNNASLMSCNLSGNGVSAATIWDGAADIQNCTMNDNCFGRYNGTLYGFWEGTKGSWVACEITHGYADGRVWNHNIQNSTFNGNEGYGMYVTNVNPGSNTVINGSNFNNNYYSGLYAIYSRLEAKDSTFNQNGTATYSGHGLLSIYNNADIQDCSADSNTYGGYYVHGLYGTNPADNGTYAQGGNTALIKNCTANNNYGRGILSWCNTGRIENCQALNTSVPDSTAISGMGMQVGYDDLAQTYRQEIINCSASGGWVGLYAYNTRTTIDGCNFNGSRYGGMYQYSTSTRTLAATQITNSSFNQNGCFGIDLYETKGVVQNVQSNLNGKKLDGTATGYGGYGMLLYGSTAPAVVHQTQSISNSQFNSNANNGLYAYYLDNLSVERCAINSSGSWALMDYASPAILKNNILTNNSAGVYLDDNLNLGVQLWNNTIASTQSTGLRIDRGNGEFRNNIISNGQYGICVYNGVTQTSSNNLVYGNTAADYWHSTQAGTTIKGANDINKSPRFADAANGDYRLAKGSPAINAGYSAVGVVDIDILGVPRPKFKLHEIGAYEYTDPNGSVRVMTWNEQK